MTSPPATRIDEVGISAMRLSQRDKIFEIFDGRIRMVDNISLMEEGITTSGFIH